MLALAGMEAPGMPIGEICHRADRVAAFLGKTLEDPVTEDDMVRILSSEEGSRKCGPPIWNTAVF